LAADRTPPRRGRPRLWERRLAPAVETPGVWVRVHVVETSRQARSAVRLLQSGLNVVPSGLWSFNTRENEVWARREASDAPVAGQRSAPDPAPTTHAAPDVATVAALAAHPSHDSAYSRNAHAAMCARCLAPLWDPNERRLREHDEAACLAERARADAAFDAEDAAPLVDLMRVGF
jgi:hypothetical protein